MRLDGATHHRLPREERMRGYREAEIRQADYFFDAFDDAVPVAVELRRKHGRRHRPDLAQSVNPRHRMGGPGERAGPVWAEIAR